jgi:hypothetical protein
MKRLPSDIWDVFLLKNYLHDSHWRMVGETCKDMYNIFQYLLSKDNYPSKRYIWIPRYDPYYNITYEFPYKACVSCNKIRYELCLSCIKYMLDKLSTRLYHRWTIPLIVNKITKIITHPIRSLCIPLLDIIKLIPKNMLVELVIETTRSFEFIDINKNSGIARLEQELCLVSEQLVSIHVWRIDIDASCIKQLVNILPKMTCLQKLNISGNDGIKDAGLAQMIDTLKSLTQLTSLNLEATQITSVGLSTLSDVFPLLTNLTELNLSWLSLTDAYILKYLLAHVPQLKLLKLNANRLGKEGIKVLTPTFTSMTQLRTLEIDYNHVGVEGYIIMADMVRKLTQLTRLDIGVSEFSENTDLVYREIYRLTNLTVLDGYTLAN